MDAPDGQAVDELLENMGTKGGLGMRVSVDKAVCVNYDEATIKAEGMEDTDLVSHVEKMRIAALQVVTQATEPDEIARKVQSLVDDLQGFCDYVNKFSDIVSKTVKDSKSRAIVQEFRDFCDAYQSFADAAGLFISEAKESADGSISAKLIACTHKITVEIEALIRASIPYEDFRLSELKLVTIQEARSHIRREAVLLHRTLCESKAHSEVRVTAPGFCDPLLQPLPYIPTNLPGVYHVRSAPLRRATLDSDSDDDGF